MVPRVLRVSVLAAALCAVALLATSCGSSSGPLAPGDAMRLHKDVGRIRAAAAAHRPQAASAAVRTLEADIGRLGAGGRLSKADARVLLSDASQVNRRVSLEVHAPAPAPPAASTPAPAPSTGVARPRAPIGSPGATGHGRHGRGHGEGGDGGDGGD